MKKIIPLLFLLLISAGAIAQQLVSAKENTNDYNIQDSVLIPTHDGTTICAIIVRKKTNTEPLPVVLFYTTYYQGPGDDIFGRKSADHNYVGVVAYCRGIRGDFKKYVPYEHDANDVYDVIDWISKQKWCNGKVGMYGGSYTGFLQWAAMKKIHPALKTIVPQVAVAPGYDFPMENNIPTSNILDWSNSIAGTKRLPRNLNQNWYDAGTSYGSIDSFAGVSNAIFQKWIKHPAYDAYWKSLIPVAEEFAQINIPVLTTTGYYDGSQIGAIYYVREHYKNNKNANHYLVIGPYDHWGGQRTGDTVLMGYPVDPVALMNMQELAYQWMDYVLKGGKKPEILKDKINYEVMGANEWKHASSLEKMNNDTLTFYLGNGNVLSPQKTKTINYASQTVDFKDRKTQNNYFTPFIINDQLDASNGLIFTTEAFDKPFSINGSFTGELQAAVNKKDMDISIALYELMPNGKYFYLTRYLGRASYAKDDSKRRLLQPGEKEKIPFNNTRIVCKQISKGSKLVIVLNVNKHPYEEINYGSGKEVSAESIKDAGDPMQIKWYTDSFIKIPVWK